MVLLFGDSRMSVPAVVVPAVAVRKLPVGAPIEPKAWAPMELSACIAPGVCGWLELLPWCVWKGIAAAAWAGEQAGGCAAGGRARGQSSRESSTHGGRKSTVGRGQVVMHACPGGAC